MGKWSVSREEMPRRVHPDFCPGWLYVTTPKVCTLYSLWSRRDKIALQTWMKETIDHFSRCRLLLLLSLQLTASNTSVGGIASEMIYR
jgi:hypothetical protein